MTAVIALLSSLIYLTQSALPTQSDFDQLSSILACGDVILPTDITFNEIAAHNWTTWDTTRVPSAIIMCYCENDVTTTMKWITPFLDSTGFRIRSGGHSFGGYSKATDAITIDLSQMKQITVVNSNKKQISVEPGTNLYDYEQWKTFNTQFTSTLPHGLCPYVAFGGYAQGGGIGLQSKQFGALSDYIYGVRVVLCDGSLWEIFDESSCKNTPKITHKCVDNCDCDNPILNKKTSQDLLYAIKGGGGGNFGIITKYYFNTIIDPETAFYFSVDFSVKTKDDIRNAHLAFKNIFDDFPDIQQDFSLALFVAPVENNDNNDFPYNFRVTFWGFYLPTAISRYDAETNFYEIINQLETYMQSSYVPTTAIIDTEKSLTDVYTQYIFPILGTAAHLHGFPSTRLVKENDYNDVSIEVLTEYIYQNVIENPLLLTGIAPSFFIESLGGKMSIRNKKTSLPKQNRKAWAVYEIFNALVSPELVPLLSDTLRTLRDTIDESVTSVFGDKKYVNYLDDVDHDLNKYYSQKEINKLSKIQRKVDPNGCFNFELGVNPQN